MAAITETDRHTEPQMHESPLTKHANISLAIRLGRTIPSIPDGGTIIGVGVVGAGSDIAERKHGDSLEEKNITLLTFPSAYTDDFPDKMADAIFGNINGGEGLSQTLQELVRIAKPEGDIQINIHKGPGQNGDFEDEELLDAHFQNAGMYIYRTEINTRGNWWEIDASTMPENMPRPKGEIRRPKIIAPDGDIYEWIGGGNNG